MAHPGLAAEREAVDVRTAEQHRVGAQRQRQRGVGVVDAKNTMVESVETIADRIRRCLKVVPADRLLVSPDCGLGYFSRTTAYAKLRNMGQAADEVRKAL